MWVTVVADVGVAVVTLLVAVWIVRRIKRAVTEIVGQVEADAYGRGFSDGREYEAEIAEFAQSLPSTDYDSPGAPKL